MHGRRKVKTTEDKLQEKREADKLKAAKYSKLVAAAFQLKEKDDKSEMALKVAGDVLTVNADCYTFWNYRREIIQHLMTVKTKEEMETIFKAEMTWLESTLAIWPKSYWVWFHRKWISQYATIDWTRELELCLKLHKVDSRNCTTCFVETSPLLSLFDALPPFFHLIWNLTPKAKVSFQSELSMAIGLIEENFSNYSAWHHRSIFLPKAFGKQEELKAQILDEFEKVKAAFYTEPEDQSAWFYHRWLVGIMKQKCPDELEVILKDQLEACEGLLSVEENCKWAMLTQVFLMMELKMDGVRPLLETLKQVDPKREGFYLDLEKKL